MKFNVTYEILTEESIEYGDAAERGFLLQDVSLRDALAEFHYHGYIEASSSHISPGDWFTAYGDMNSRTGESENRSLHPPRNISMASLKRIAHLLGVKTR